MSDTGMDEAGQPGVSTPLGAGGRLREARERQGLSLVDIATRTRIPLRHLEAIESGDYRALPSATYAVGFARAYARAVGIDEVEIAAAARGEADRQGRRHPEYVPYETADPARVPSRGVAVVTLGLALAVLILAGLWFATDLFRPAAPATPTVAAVEPPRAIPAPTPSPAAPIGGQVTLTASDDVWLRVYDADDKTLYLGTMHAGDHFAVPADAHDPRINVGRPDKLQVALNGAATPPLGDGSRPIKGVAVSGAAVAARLAAASAGSPPADRVAPAGAAVPGNGL